MNTCGKVAYSSKREAQTVINAIMTGHGRQNRPERLRAYHCEVCTLYHLTRGRHSRFKPMKGNSLTPRERREVMRLKEREEVYV